MIYSKKTLQKNSKDYSTVVWMIDTSNNYHSDCSIWNKFQMILLGFSFSQPFQSTTVFELKWSQSDACLSIFTVFNQRYSMFFFVNFLNTCTSKCTTRSIFSLSLSLCVINVPFHWRSRDSRRKEKFVDLFILFENSNWFEESKKSVPIWEVNDQMSVSMKIGWKKTRKRKRNDDDNLRKRGKINKKKKSSSRITDRKNDVVHFILYHFSM